VLALGFLYEMRDHCASVAVEPVRAATRRPWFAEAIAAAAAADAAAVVS
jgi:hypothetical protein